LFDGDLIPCGSLEASAHPSSQFSLSSAGEDVLRLRYVADAEVETHGGIAYQSECGGHRWTLQFFRTPFLQRESYRVFRSGTLVASTDVFKPLRTAAITYSDGTIWQCHIKMFGAEVDNSEGIRVLHTSPRIGLMMGGSSILVDHEMEEQHGLPLLLILTHFTTHSDR
jgi:hypothetical protein